MEVYKPPSAEPVSTFIRNFERFIEPHKLSDDDKLKFILRKVGGSALRIAEKCTSYTEVVTRLMKEFEPSQTEVWH